MNFNAGTTIRDCINRAVMQKYWYYITIYYCPQCNKTVEIRERKYTLRPDKWEERHEVKEQYDWCG